MLYSCTHVATVGIKGLMFEMIKYNQHDHGFIHLESYMTLLVLW